MRVSKTQSFKLFPASWGAERCSEEQPQQGSAHQSTWPGRRQTRAREKLGAVLTHYCPLNLMPPRSFFSEVMLFSIADSQQRSWTRAVTKYQLRDQAEDVKSAISNLKDINFEIWLKSK